MTIQELEVATMTPALAYVLGLIFPFFTDREEVEDKFNHKKFAAGCINHNANMVTEADLAAHFKSVINLCRELDIYIRVNARNPHNIHDFSCSSKRGFSCLIETTGKTKIYCENIFRNRVKEIEQTQNLEIKKLFARGCFDGRGSWDSTLHCFSVDVDRKAVQPANRQDQFLIESICNSVIGNGAIQINQRAWGYKKNDQLRVRKNFLRIFINNVDLFSIARKRILQNGLQSIGV